MASRTLRTCGGSRSAVQCLLIAPENLTLIIEELRTRFGQADHIIRSLVQKARETPAVKEEKLETLIEFSQAVRSLTETIKSLHSRDHFANPILLDDLVMKLPPKYKMQWMEVVHRGAEKNLVEFSAWLKVKSDIACQLCPPHSISESVVEKKKCRILAVEDTEEPEPTSKKKSPRTQACHFCEKNDHRILKCPAFKKETPEGRIQQVSSKRLCFGCLNAGHGFRDCISKKQCIVTGCDKTHHPMLHITNKTPAPNHVKVAELEDVLHISGQVAYQILPVSLRGPEGEVNTYAMLDPGSAFTIIDEALSKELGLE